jgi:hypothetical protein
VVVGACTMRLSFLFPPNVPTDAGNRVNLVAQRLAGNADRNLALEAKRRVVRGDDPAGLEVIVNHVLCPRGRAAGHGALLNGAIDSVAKKQVGAATEGAGDDVLASDLEKLCLERLGVLAELGGVLCHEVGHDARVLGSGHGGTGKKVDNVVAGAPGAEDLLAGRIDVDALSNVGESGDPVVDVDGADSDDVRVGATKVGRGRAASISSIVTGSNGDVDSGVDGGQDGLIDRVGGTLKTPGHAHDGTNETTLGLALLVVVDDPVHAGNGAGRGTGAIVAENLDSNNVGVLGNTELGTCSRASHVSAVAIAVSSCVSEGEAFGGASCEDGVGDADTSVDDVDVDTSTEIGVFKGVGEVLARWVASGAGLVGDALEAPWCAGLLGDKRLDLGGLVDQFDFGKVFEVADALGGSVHDNSTPLRVVHDIKDTVVVSLPSQLVEQRLGLWDLVLVEHDDDLFRVGGVVSARGVLGQTNQTINSLFGGGKGLDVLGGGGSNGIGERGRKGGNGKRSPHIGLGRRETGSAG